MPILKLVRFPMLFIAAAHALAGYFVMFFRFSGNMNGGLRDLVLVLISCVFLEAACMSWGGAFDLSARLAREEEAGHAFHKPLLSMNVCFFLAVIFTVGGVLLAMTCSFATFLASSLFLVAGFLHSAGARRIEILGPVSFGLHHAAAFLLGMSVHPYTMILFDRPVFVVACLLLAVYLAMVFFWKMLQDEADLAADNTAEEAAEGAQAQSVDKSSATDTVVLVLGALSLMVVPVAAAWIMPWNPIAQGLFAAQFVLLVFPVAGALRKGGMGGFSAVARAGLLGAVFLDAGMLASLVSAGAGKLHIAGVVMVAAMILPAMVFQRKIPDGV